MKHFLKIQRDNWCSTCGVYDSCPQEASPLDSRIPRLGTFCNQHCKRCSSAHCKFTPGFQPCDLCKKWDHCRKCPTSYSNHNTETLVFKNAAVKHKTASSNYETAFSDCKTETLPPLLKYTLYRTASSAHKTANSIYQTTLFNYRAKITGPSLCYTCFNADFHQCTDCGVKIHWSRPVSTCTFHPVPAVPLADLRLDPVTFTNTPANICSLCHSESIQELQKCPPDVVQLLMEFVPVCGAEPCCGCGRIIHREQFSACESGLAICNHCGPVQIITCDGDCCAECGACEMCRLFCDSDDSDWDS